VSRLEAKGEFKKLLNLEKPVFETVEAEGAELRLEQKTSSEEETDYQNLILQAAEILGYARKLSMKDSRITASFLPGKVNLEKVNLGLSKSPAENTFAYALVGSSRLLFKAPSAPDFPGRLYSRENSGGGEV
jgi:hypothetical protein